MVLLSDDELVDVFLLLDLLVGETFDQLRDAEWIIVGQSEGY